MSKQRLDTLLLQRGLVPTRSKAQALVMAGEVWVNGMQAQKPGMAVLDSSEIVLKARKRFVSRGGDKLAAALDAFGISVTNMICADVGASTGGFTDCLLQGGASRIYAIDVGYGQLDFSLRQDSRVVVMDRTNARYVSQLPELVDLVTVDASFISLQILIPTILNWLSSSGQIVTLIKPQFEAGKDEVGKGGVVRNTTTHRRVVSQLLTFAQSLSLRASAVMVSPLKGPAGNIEFLAHFQVEGMPCSQEDLDSLIASLFPVST